MAAELSREDLLGLIRRGEWTDLEAKAAAWQCPVKSLKPTVSAFCNTDGGIVVLGVEQDKRTHRLRPTASVFRQSGPTILSSPAPISTCCAGWTRIAVIARAAPKG